MAERDRGNQSAGAPTPRTDGSLELPLASALSSPDPQIREAAWRTWVQRDWRASVNRALQLRNKSIATGRPRLTHISPEDEAQEAWISLAGRDHSRAVELTGVLINEVNWRVSDGSRRAGRRATEVPMSPLQDGGYSQLESSFDGLRTSVPSAESAVVNGMDEDERLKKLLDKIPDPFRAVVYLADVKGYSHREIAQILALNNEGTVRTRLHRGRGTLRRALTNGKDEKPTSTKEGPSRILSACKADDTVEDSGAWTVPANQERGQIPQRFPTVEFVGNDGDRHVLPSDNRSQRSDSKDSR